METTLNEINFVLGVTGSFVCSSDGSLVAKVLPDSYDLARIEIAARVASQTFSALEASDQRITNMDLLFDQNRLILRKLRGGLLAILCARNTSLPVLNLTIAAAAKKIAAELKPSPPAAVPGVPPIVAPDRAMPKAAAALGIPRPSSGDVPGSIAASSEIVAASFFEQLTRELIHVMGAPAGIIIEDEISALKATRERFPKARAAELVERIGTAIRDETKRNRFQQVMLEAIRNLE